MYCLPVNSTCSKVDDEWQVSRLFLSNDSTCGWNSNDPDALWRCCRAGLTLRRCPNLWRCWRSFGICPDSSFAPPLFLFFFLFFQGMFPVISWFVDDLFISSTKMKYIRKNMILTMNINKEVHCLQQEISRDLFLHILITYTIFSQKNYALVKINSAKCTWHNKEDRPHPTKANE